MKLHSIFGYGHALIFYWEQTDRRLNFMLLLIIIWQFIDEFIEICCQLAVLKKFSLSQITIVDYRIDLIVGLIVAVV